MKHVRWNHWKTYHCSKCESAFSSSTDCKRHLETIHPAGRPAADLDALVKLSERSFDIRKGVSCPLCHEVLHSIQQYQRHVGQHQEQLALFALPSPDVDNKSETQAADSEVDDDEHGDGTNSVSTKEPSCSPLLEGTPRPVTPDLGTGLAGDPRPAAI